MPQLRCSLVAAAVALPLAAPARGQESKPTTSITADLGFVSATGNAQLQTLSVGDKLAFTPGRWTLSQLTAYVYGKTKHLSTANHLRVAVRGDYKIEQRLAVFAGSSFERNR